MDLKTEQILHIEHIDNAFAIGRHGGRLNLQAKIGKRVRQPVEQAREIASIDLDDSVGGADPVR